MRIAVLGISGMAGHVVALWFAERGHDVLGLARDPLPLPGVATASVDLMSPSGLARLGELQGYDAVVNCVGILPRVAEARPDVAAYLNAYLPHHLVHTFGQSRTKVVHLSTDCVFSGKDGSYTETAFRDGDTIYDRSKALGEFWSRKDVVLRQSIIGPELRSDGVGLLNWYLGQNGAVGGYDNAIWNGLSTLELAAGVEAAIDSGLTGLYHLVAPVAVSKLALLRMFQKEFTGSADVSPSALPHRMDKSLVNTRADFDFRPRTLEQQVSELALWMRAHRALYPHYSRALQPPTD